MQTEQKNVGESMERKITKQKEQKESGQESEGGREPEEEKERVCMRKIQRVKNIPKVKKERLTLNLT